MKTVLLLYGLQGSDAPHWQSYLQKELSSLGYNVLFPQFSNNLNPIKEVWIEEAVELIQNNDIDIVVTHSLGNILWFHLCGDERLKALHVEKLLLVAPPRDLSAMSVVETFFPYTLPKSLHASEVLMVGSDNDEYINVTELSALAKSLHVEKKIVNNAGHINAKSGYGDWPWAKEWITN